ncbi:hypothetical protein V6E34_05655, partial [Serratia marcescens]
MAQMSKEDQQFNAGNTAVQVNDGGEFAEYTPEQFGAVGDGLADDREAVSAMFAKVAIDAAKSIKKRQVRMANV